MKMNDIHLLIAEIRATHPALAAQVEALILLYANAAFERDTLRLELQQLRSTLWPKNP